MADLETSVLEVSIGDPHAPGDHIRLFLDFEMGGSVVPDSKANFASILGSEPEPAVFYVTLPTENAALAQELAEGLQRTIEEVGKEPEDSRSVLANGWRILSQQVNVNVSHHNENVIVAIEPHPVLQKQGSGVEESLGAQVAPLLENRNHAAFSFDFGTNFATLLDSNNLVLELFNSCDVRLEFGLVPNFGNVVHQSVATMGLFEPILIAISFASLFKNAEMQFKFASASQLPDPIKSMIPPTQSLMSYKNMMLLMLSSIDKTLLKLLNSHCAGKANLIVIGTHAVTRLEVSLPGLAKALTFDISGHEKPST